MLNNFGPPFKIYLIVVNNWMQKDKQLEKIKVLFKAIEEEETCIKAKSKASANFAVTKLYSKPQEGVVPKRKKKFIVCQNAGNVALSI